MKRIFRVIYKKKPGLSLQIQPEYFVEQVFFITGTITSLNIPSPIGFEIHSITEILESKEIQYPDSNEKAFNKVN